MSEIASAKESSNSRSLATLFAYSALSQAALGLSYPGTPLYLHSLGLDANLINAILTSLALASLMGQIMWGFLSDRVLPKLACVEIGCIGSAIGFLALTGVRDALAFASVYVLSGFIGSAAYPAAMALLANISPGHRRGRSMGLFWSAASVGWAVAVAFTGWIIEHLGGLFLFGSCALLHLASLIIVYLGLRVQGHGDSGSTGKASSGSGPFTALSHLGRSFMALFIGTIVFFILDFAKNVYVPMFYAFDVGLHVTMATLLLSFTSWIEVPATVLFGVVSDRIGRVKVVLTGYLLSVAFMALNMWVGGIELAILAMGIYGLVWGAFSAATSALASELVTEEHRGLAMGLFNSAASLASILTPLAIGTLIQLSGYRIAFGVMALLMLLFSLFTSLGMRGKNKADSS